MCRQAVGTAAWTSFSGLGMDNGKNHPWTQQGFPPRWRQTKTKEALLSRVFPYLVVHTLLDFV